ncbi:hypothetical protein T11_12938 [Trichinella zimbabwensis]|uniref:Uncharacterized protein n=1 Tax=Trichinella zimbabwensis TaxID=268475 RepID=A0A0V1I628_9BILA|nr:hypothetical protein T11_12938 [Trichinella zimbabwensis]
MDALLDGCILTSLLLGTVITSCFLFCIIRRIKACIEDDEKNLKKPVTNVVSENGQTEGSAKVKFDSQKKKEQKSKPIVLVVPVLFRKPTSGFDEEATLELKYRCNKKGVVVYRPKWKKNVNAPDLGVNAVQSSVMKTG